MQTTITVTGKILGQKKPLFTDWAISLPPDLFGSGDRLTLRDLITRIVLEEVEAFRERQEERRLTRVLSKAEIEQGVERGKVDMGGHDLAQEVDPQAAVDTALQAFEDGLYLVVIDEQQQHKLEHEVYLRPNSQVMFIRLVLLAGG